MSMQYRVSFGKNDDEVDGADDAATVVTIAVADTALEPTVAFMLGKLKSAGPTGPLLAALRDGSAALTLRQLASRRAGSGTR